jgi:hypothetical protein
MEDRPLGSAAEQSSNRRMEIGLVAQIPTQARFQSLEPSRAIVISSFISQHNYTIARSVPDCNENRRVA